MAVVMFKYHIYEGIMIMCIFWHNFSRGHSSRSFDRGMVRSESMYFNQWFLQLFNIVYGFLCLYKSGINHI